MKTFSIKSLFVLTFAASVIIALAIPCFNILKQNRDPQKREPYYAIWKVAKKEIEKRGEFQPRLDSSVISKCHGNWYVMVRPRKTMLLNWGVFLEIDENGQVLRYEKGPVNQYFFADEVDKREGTMDKRNETQLID